MAMPMAIRLLACAGPNGPKMDWSPGSGEDRLVVDYGTAARRLSVSERTVRRLVATGQLPAVKIGDLNRITVDDLAAFAAGLDRRRFDVKEEIREAG